MTDEIYSNAAATIKVHVAPSSGELRILCATDLSPRSNHAVQRARLLARHLDAELLLLHVVDERQALSLIGLKADRARNVLQWQVRQVTSMDEPSVEISIRVGKLHQTIASVAKEWCADLLILGSYSKRTGDKLLGTTAERVVRAGSRPVLVVNGEAKTAYESVLLASDLSDEFARVARMTHQLRLLDNAQVSVMHALEPASRAMLYSAGVSEPHIAQYLRSVKQSSRNELFAQLQTVDLDSSRFLIMQESGKPFRAIERTVEGMQPQLLVIGMSRYSALKRLLVGSVANEVLRKVQCDVLIASPAAVARTHSTIRSVRMTQNRPGTRAVHTGMNETVRTA